MSTERWPCSNTACSDSQRGKKKKLFFLKKKITQFYSSFPIFSFPRVQETVESPQGDNSKELAEAQNKLNIAQTALDEVSTQLKSVQTAKAETAEKERQLEAKEMELRAAEAELKAAVDDLTAQETAFKTKVCKIFL